MRWSDERPCEANATRERGANHTWCVFGAGGVLVPWAGVGLPGKNGSLVAYAPPVTGFVTKGDHNPAIDATGISLDEHRRPSDVPLAWVVGKARGELPWIGLVKLALAGRPNQPNPPASWVKVGSAYAPRDLWIMLAVLLVLVIGVPLGLDARRALQRRRGSRGPDGERGAKPQERDPPPGG